MHLSYTKYSLFRTCWSSFVVFLYISYLSAFSWSLWSSYNEPSTSARCFVMVAAMLNGSIRSQVRALFKFVPNAHSQLPEGGKFRVVSVLPMIAWVSGVSVGKRGKMEAKKGESWHRCFYWSLPPQNSMIRYHPIKITSGHWVVSFTCQKARLK